MAGRDHMEPPLPAGERGFFAGGGDPRQIFQPLAAEELAVAAARAIAEAIAAIVTAAGEWPHVVHRPDDGHLDPSRREEQLPIEQIADPVKIDDVGFRIQAFQQRHPPLRMVEAEDASVVIDGSGAGEVVADLGPYLLLEFGRGLAFVDGADERIVGAALIDQH